MSARDLPLRAMRAALLRWYDEHQREMPWRAPPGTRSDPYRVWLSEVMLQQTRVETVRSYYGRWLERFPTLDALARAPVDDVLKAWEGLGYYSRARNLHRAVREVADRYGGEVPDEPDLFRALPGVGRYTAGAVMSIAFGREEPVVDGNVRRVAARWLDAETPTERQLWALAEELVRGERPGDLNQAVMELGATVCTPRSPACERCPVADSCRARLAGTQAERPKPKVQRALPTETHAVLVAFDGHRYMLRRRPERGLLAGMWEFPSLPLLEGEGEGEGNGIDARIRELASPLQSNAGYPIPLPKVEHAFSHLRAVYHPCLVRCGSTSTGIWMNPAEIDARAALPRAQRRILEMAMEVG